MKPDLFPRTASRAQRLRYAEALHRIQRRNHKLRVGPIRVGPLRALLLLLTAPFRSSHPAVFVLSLCVAWLVGWVGVRLLNF